MKTLKVRKSDYLLHQWAFLRSSYIITGLIAGMGAGKTYVFIRKMFLNHLFRKNPKKGISKGWVIYPTFDLAEELFVDPFTDLLIKFGIKYNYDKSRHRFTTPYGTLKIYQLQRPQRIVGAELTFIGFDEFDVESWKNCDIAFKKALGRMRGSGDVTMDFVSTPEGLHYLYKIFVTDNKGDRLLIKAKTEDNPYNPPGYTLLLKENYPPKLLRAYMNGEFVSLMEGTLYYNFDKLIHTTKETENPDNALFLSCDFNKSPMSWVVAQVNPSIKGNSLHYIAQIFIKTSATTKKSAEMFLDRFKNHNKKEVYITGDASGNITNTRDYTTDYLIIKDILKAAGWNVLLDIPKSNPSINNRINITTTLIHQGRIKVHESMVDLIKDYENVIGDGHGAKDKGNADLTHASDAADYLTYKLFYKEFFKLTTRQI